MKLLALQMEFDLEQRLRQYYDAWSRQDIDAVMGFFTDASSLEDLGVADKFEGLEQIRSFVELTYAFSPDFRIQPTKIIVGDGAAAVAGTMSGTHSGDSPGLPATGKRFRVRAASIIDFDEDRIKTEVDYWNLVEFKRSVELA